MVERGVEADAELVELHIDAELEELGAGAGLAGDSLEGVRCVGAAAQGVGEARVRFGQAVDEAARWGGLVTVIGPVKGLVGVVFHGRAPWRGVGIKCRADGCGS